MAMAAKVVIVEAENIVETGQIDPDHVMAPGIFVDWIVQGIILTIVEHGNTD